MLVSADYDLDLCCDRRSEELVVRCVRCDRLRERNRRNERESPGAVPDSLPDRAADPVQEAESDELANRLRIALAQLPPREAEVFTLRFVEDMSYRKIGSTLGLKANAVGVLLHQARERLRGMLADRAGLADDRRRG